METLGWWAVHWSSFDHAQGIVQNHKQPKKSQLCEILELGSWNLSSAEATLFARKIKDAVSFCKRKRRDAGSGKFMNPAVQTLLKTLKVKKAASATKKDTSPPQPTSPSKKDIRSVFGLEEKQSVDMVSVASSSSQTWHSLLVHHPHMQGVLVQHPRIQGVLLPQHFQPVVL